MRILVISDTHKQIGGAMRVLNSLPQMTHVVHLGDYVGDALDLQSVFPQLTFHMVRGNNDFDRGVPDQLWLDFFGQRVLALHGHQHGVKFGLDRLADYGAQNGANLVLFGHTHRFCNRVIRGVQLLNPSSSGYLLIDNRGIEVGSY